MDILADIENIKHQIKKSIDSQNKEQVLLLLKQAFALCEKFKETVSTVGEEEKNRLSEEMKKFREFLAEQMQRLSKKTGMTEEDLIKRRENPENFTKEQWIALQMIRKKFSSKVKDIRKVMKSSPSSSKKKGSDRVVLELPPAVKEMMEKNPEMAKLMPRGLLRKKERKKPVTKSKWMKT